MGAGGGGDRGSRRPGRGGRARARGRLEQVVAQQTPGQQGLLGGHFAADLQRAGSRQATIERLGAAAGGLRFCCVQGLVQVVEMQRMVAGCHSRLRVMVASLRETADLSKLAAQVRTPGPWLWQCACGRHWHAHCTHCTCLRSARLALCLSHHSQAPRDGLLGCCSSTLRMPALCKARPLSVSSPPGAPGRALGLLLLHACALQGSPSVCLITARHATTCSPPRADQGSGAAAAPRRKAPAPCSTLACARASTPSPSRPPLPPSSSRTRTRLMRPGSLWRRRRTTAATRTSRA